VFFARNFNLKQASTKMFQGTSPRLKDATFGEIQISGNKFLTGKFSGSGPEMTILRYIHRLSLFLTLNHQLFKYLLVCTQRPKNDATITRKNDDATVNLTILKCRSFNGRNRKSLIQSIVSFHRKEISYLVSLTSFGVTVE